MQRGCPRDVLLRVIKETGATGVYWNRCYEPPTIERDRLIKVQLSSLEENFRVWQKGMTGYPIINHTRARERALMTFKPIIS